MTKQRTPAETRRLKQTAQYTFASRNVGVMNVWQEEAGTMVAQLSIFDPATNTSEMMRVRIGDQLDLGTERFEVVQIVSEQGDGLAWLEISPTSGAAPPNQSRGAATP